MGHEVVSTKKNIKPEEAKCYDLLISFGYKKIINKETINACVRPPINLHISYLPYNRGCHPNFWAWMENTPHGVTIHHIDDGIDTGDIIIQERVYFPPKTTLVDSYNKLIERIERLFKKNIVKLLSYQYITKKQEGMGSLHYKKELPKFKGGWDQSIEDIKHQLSII